MKENISINKNIYSSNKFREVIDTNFSELINARDAVWDINDPWPFILMMPMSSEIMWKAMTSSMTLGEVSQLDIAWIPKLEEE